MRVPCARQTRREMRAEGARYSDAPQRHDAREERRAALSFMPPDMRL